MAGTSMEIAAILEVEKGHTEVAQTGQAPRPSGGHRSPCPASASPVGHNLKMSLSKAEASLPHTSVFVIGRQLKTISRKKKAGVPDLELRT